jgi:uncharacterized GH25 family protein
MNRKMAFTIAISFIAVIAMSHEFWLLPKKFRYAMGEEAVVDFLVGENFEGEAWNLKKNRIEKIDHHHLAKATDIRSLLKPEEKEKLKIKLAEEGTHLITMQSNFASIELDAEKFNAYLEEDGLENVMELRKKNNTTAKPGKEKYARYTKLILQAGSKTDDTYKKKTGLRMEIIPSTNPYKLKSGDYLECQILFDGKPVPHQLVKVWNKINTTTFLQNIYTENDGTIKFPISSKGPWMVSAVKMIPSETPDAEWQSMWGSLIFGIE